jgi:uncharacterized protein DUF4405
MRKSVYNYVVDVILFALLAGMTFIGILLAWALPAGPGQSKIFWSLHRHDWGDIHLWLSLAFVLFLVVHLVLHWKWIKGATRRIFGRSWVLSLVVIVPALCLFLIGLGLSGDSTSRRGWGEGIGQGRGHRVERSECTTKQEDSKQINFRRSEQKQVRRRYRGGRG